MRFVKLLAAFLAVCMLSCAFIACDGGDTATEAPTEAKEKVKLDVTLVIKDGDKQVAEEKIPYEGTDATLKSVIEFYCAINDYSTDCFDSNGLLNAIGDLTGSWEGYDAAAGSNNKIKSLKDFEVTNGMTVVLTCTK